jgi:hypothetical protein
MFTKMLYNQAPFLMLKHQSTARNGKRFSKLSGALENQFTDGLSNIQNKTRITRIDFYPSFTHLSIDILD